MRHHIHHHTHTILAVTLPSLVLLTVFVVGAVLNGT